MMVIWAILQEEEENRWFFRNNHVIGSTMVLDRKFKRICKFALKIVVVLGEFSIRVEIQIKFTIGIRIGSVKCFCSADNWNCCLDIRQ